MNKRGKRALGAWALVISLFITLLGLLQITPDPSSWRPTNWQLVALVALSNLIVVSLLSAVFLSISMRQANGSRIQPKSWLRHPVMIAPYVLSLLGSILLVIEGAAMVFRQGADPQVSTAAVIVLLAFTAIVVFSATIFPFALLAKSLIGLDAAIGKSTWQYQLSQWFGLLGLTAPFVGWLVAIQWPEFQIKKGEVDSKMASSGLTVMAWVASIFCGSSFYWIGKRVGAVLDKSRGPWK